MSKQLEKIGDAIAKARSIAEQTRLNAQAETTRAHQAAQREERALERFAQLCEEKTKAQERLELGRKSLASLTSAEKRAEFVSDAAGMLIHNGEAAVDNFTALLAMEWLDNHAKEVGIAMADKTVGAVERQLAALRQEAGDVLTKHGLA